MAEKGLLTKAETGEYMRVSLATIDRLMKTRQLPFIKLGKRVLFKKADVDRFLESRKVG